LEQELMLKGAYAERSLKQGLGVATPRQLVNQFVLYDMLPSIEDIGVKAGNLASSWRRFERG
jgi:hypothetical protein